MCTIPARNEFRSGGKLGTIRLMGFILPQYRSTPSQLNQHFRIAPSAMVTRVLAHILELPAKGRHLGVRVGGEG